MTATFILAQESTNGGGSSAIGFIVWIGVLVGVFYFLIFRPQRTRAKRHRDLMSTLEVGDEVRSAGGIYGHIRDLDDDSAVIEVEDGTRLRIARGAIAAKIQPPSEE